MTDRIEKIREKAELVRQTKPLWRTMTASEAVFFRDGFAVALTYTDEDESKVLSAARAEYQKAYQTSHDPAVARLVDAVAIAALESFGARRAE